MTIRPFLVLLLAACAVGFGAVVANRLGTETLAVVVGLVCGVGGAIPSSLLVLYATRERRRPAEPEPQAGYPGMPYGGMMMPPVVMMMPQQQPAPPSLPASAGVRLDSPTRVPYLVDEDDQP